MYISRQRVLHKLTWSKIREGKDNWKDWPDHIISNRWYRKLKAENRHPTDIAFPGTRQTPGESSEDDLAHSPVHHLPTPSSIGQEDTFVEVDDGTQSPAAHIKSSSTHFDDDERELLSLAGDEEPMPVNVDEEEFFPDEDEVILPSIESDTSFSEDALQRSLLENSPLAEVTRHASVNIKTEPEETLPTRKRRRTQAHKKQNARPHSNVANESVDAIATPKRPVHAIVPNPPSTHTNLRPRSTSGSIDLIGLDELQAPEPSTPRIKREHSTPPAASFLFTTPAPQSHSRPHLSSSAAKSTSRKAYLKQVKQSWAKGGTPRPKTAYKRRSFHVAPRKRGWDEDSADELGM